MVEHEELGVKTEIKIKFEKDDGIAYDHFRKPDSVQEDFSHSEINSGSILSHLALIASLSLTNALVRPKLTMYLVTYNHREYSGLDKLMKYIYTFQRNKYADVAFQFLLIFPL
ncbi:hypothetical protein D3C77_532070 [compost metagenome]